MQNCQGQQQIIGLSGDQKNAIVSQHNQFRNTVAGGNQYGLSSAARMLELTWDDELSRLAEFNVKYCNISYDFCHKTDNYPYSGQNIFSAQSFNNFLDTNTVIQDAIKAWYSSSQYATQNSLDYFTGYSQKFVSIQVFLELN